jgi:hypothetical protein
MKSRELLLSHLLSRVVHDADGRRVGRIEELIATMQLHEHGNDYAVTEFHVGAFGLFEAMAGGRFARHFLQRFGRFAGYRLFRIPWDWMDLTDPEHPRMTRRRAELESR